MSYHTIPDWECRAGLWLLIKEQTLDHALWVSYHTSQRHRKRVLLINYNEYFISTRPCCRLDVCVVLCADMWRISWFTGVAPRWLQTAEDQCWNVLLCSPCFTLPSSVLYSRHYQPPLITSFLPPPLPPLFTCSPLFTLICHQREKRGILPEAY